MIRGELTAVAASLLAAALLIPCTGCSKQKDVTRYELSGTVQFKQQPVPAGSIRFTPDVSTGNTGPASYVSFVNGQYRLPKSQGIVGGKYHVTIEGFDGSGQPIPGEQSNSLGNPLFRQSLQVEFPSTRSEYDFQL